MKKTTALSGLLAIGAMIVGVSAANSADFTISGKVPDPIDALPAIATGGGGLSGTPGSAFTIPEIADPTTGHAKVQTLSLTFNDFLLNTNKSVKISSATSGFSTSTANPNNAVYTSAITYSATSTGTAGCYSSITINPVDTTPRAIGSTSSLCYGNVTVNISILDGGLKLIPGATYQDTIAIIVENT